MLRDEIYQIKDFSRDNVRVLLRLDAGLSRAQTELALVELLTPLLEGR